MWSKKGIQLLTDSFNFMRTTGCCRNYIFTRNHNVDLFEYTKTNWNFLFKYSSLKKSDSIKSQNKRRRILSSEEESPQKISPAKKKTPRNSEIKIEEVDDKETKVKNDKKTPNKTPKKTPKTSIKIKKENEKKSIKRSPSPSTKDESMEEESPSTENIKKVKIENSPTTKNVEESPKDSKKDVNGFFSNKKDLKLQNAGEGQKGADYNPGKNNYHPIDDAFWKYGEKVPYLALAKTFEIIENTSGRLKSIETLSNFFRSVIVLSRSDLLACVYLSLNQLAPAYESIELGVAETTLMKAIAQSTGRTMQQIKSDAQSTGDLGVVAEQSRSNQRMMFTPAPHTIECVFSKLREIAGMSGVSAMSKKVDKIQSMFVACRHSEARYIIRSLAGKLRIGLAEQSLLQALAQACATTPPNQKEYPPKILNALKKLNENTAKNKIEDVALILKSTYCQCPNYDLIIPILLEDGIDVLLDKCEMKPGTPLKPMLAHPTNGVNEIFQRFEGINFTCEWKYDGERAQIHIDEDGTVSIYSRNQENNTSKYPDIIGRIKDVKGAKVQSCIMDTEAVAWDKEKKQILPFQILSTRKRKDATESDIKVQVCVYMFDLLYLNKKPLTKLPFAERRKLLHENFVEIEGEWKFATYVDTGDIDEIQSFLEESVKGNCEGLMVKTLDKEATYEIAKRSRNWLKLKKDYLSGVGDSLDLVVIGGYKGRGKRTGTYGGFLLACYDQANEDYQSICKIGTGFSDEDLKTHTDFLKPHVVGKPKAYYRYDSSHEPDEWFEPVQVWEVKCADLSLSPVHQAAMGIIDPEKGISLRFPRFIRIRDDKSVEDATTAEQVADMYSNQDQIKNQDKTAAIKDEDFY